MITDWSNKTRASLEILIGCLVTVLNILEIVILSRLRRRWSNYEVVLLSLSVADLLYGMSNISIGVAFFASDINEEVFEITTTTSFFFVLTSIFHLSWIGIDRLWAVYSPMKHNYLVTRKVIGVVLCMTWFSTIFVSLFLVLRDEFIVEKQGGAAALLIRNQTVAQHLMRYERYMDLTLSGFIAGANVVFVCVYGVLIRTILRRKKLKANMIMTTQNSPKFTKNNVIANNAISSSKNDDDSSKNKAKVVENSAQNKTAGSSEEFRIAVTCALITVSFVCLTMPTSIRVFFFSEATKTATTVTSLLLQLNSGVNSVVYFLRTKTSRWFHKRRHHNNNSSRKNQFGMAVFRNTETTTPSTARRINADDINANQ